MPRIVYRLETEVEKDGRWIAEIPELPAVLAYGSTENEALTAARLWHCVCQRTVSKGMKLEVEQAS